jgi:cytochrome c556
LAVVRCREAKKGSTFDKKGGDTQTRPHYQTAEMITMNNTKSRGALLFLLAVLVATATALTAMAQVKKGKSRPMETRQLMKAVMKPQCTLLKQGLDTAPSDDKAWSELATHAALLNEISYLLMDDGRCPDGIWADAASKTLRQGSADALKAIEAKDHAAAKTAFGNLAKSCKACHDKHKPKE